MQRYPLPVISLTFATEPYSQPLCNRIPGNGNTRLAIRRFDGFGFGVGTLRRSAFSWRHAAHRMFPANLSNLLLPIRRLTLMCHHVLQLPHADTQQYNSMYVLCPIRLRPEPAVKSESVTCNSSTLSIAHFFFTNSHVARLLTPGHTFQFQDRTMRRMRHLPFKSRKGGTN